MFMHVRREDDRSLCSYFDFDDFEYRIVNGISSYNQELYLKFYSENMAYIAHVHLIFHNLYEYVVKKRYSINYAEQSPLNLNYVVDALKEGKLLPDDLLSKPFICVCDFLEVASEFEGTEIDNLIISNISEITAFYNAIKIFGVIAFPGETEETTMVNGEWNFDKDSLYLDKLSLLVRNGFSRIGDSNYFFKEC